MERFIQYVAAKRGMIDALRSIVSADSELYANTDARSSSERGTDTAVNVPLQPDSILRMRQGPMNIDHDAFEKVSVIRVSGDLGCMSADALRQAVYSLLARGHRTILVNFANVARIDAAGLGTLAQVHRLATIVGAVVTLTNIHPRVRELLDLAGLAACFDISASECEALEDLELCALT